MNNKSRKGTALNGGAKRLLLNILSIKQIIELLEREEIKVEGFNLPGDAFILIWYEIFEAFKSLKERDELLKQIGTLLAEKQLIFEDLVKLKSRLDLPPDYPVSKLEGNFTIKELYLKGEVSRLFYLRFKNIAPTVHHLAAWSLADLKRWKGFGEKIQAEFVVLKRKHKIDETLNKNL